MAKETEGISPSLAFAGKEMKATPDLTLRCSSATWGPNAAQKLSTRIAPCIINSLLLFPELLKRSKTWLTKIFFFLPLPPPYLKTYEKVHFVPDSGTVRNPKVGKTYPSSLPAWIRTAASSRTFFICLRICRATKPLHAAKKKKKKKRARVAVKPTDGALTQNTRSHFKTTLKPGGPRMDPSELSEVLLSPLKRRSQRAKVKPRLANVSHSRCSGKQRSGGSS